MDEFEWPWRNVPRLERIRTYAGEPRVVIDSVYPKQVYRECLSDILRLRDRERDRISAAEHAMEARSYTEEDQALCGLWKAFKDSEYTARIEMKSANNNERQETALYALFDAAAKIYRYYQI